MYMATSRPFAYNTGSTIDGTLQVGDIAIGDTAQDYSQGPGGVTWFMGPDESRGYLLTHVDENSGHSSPSGNAKLAFARSADFTDESFIALVNRTSLETGGTGVTSSSDASVWAEEQGMYINTGYCTEYQTLYDSWTNKPNVALSAAYNVLFNKLKGLTPIGINFLDKFDAAWLFGGHTNDDGEALKNIVNPGTNDATLVNAPYFNNFSGFKGDAVSRYIQMNWNGNTDGVKFKLNDASWGVYGLDEVELGNKIHGTTNFLIANSYNNDKIIRFHSTTLSYHGVEASYKGLSAAVRNNSVNVNYFDDTFDNQTNPSSSLFNVDFTVLAYGPAIATYASDERIGFCFAGGALSEGESQELETILDWWFNFEWLTLGGEMIYNGDMAISTGGLASGLTQTNGIVSIVTGNGFPGNAQRHEADLTENTFMRIYEEPEADKYYLLDFKCRNNNGCTFYFGGVGTNVKPSTTAQTIRSVVKATNTIELRMYVRSSSGDAEAGDWVEYSDISIKEIIGLTN